MDFKQPALFELNVNIKFLLASLKTCFNSKYCSKSHIKFLLWLSSLLLVDFFQGTFMAGFRNNFQALSMQLLVSQAAIGKLEQAYWRELLEEFSLLVSDFIKSKQNIIFDFVTKRQLKIVKTVSPHIKNTVLIFRTLRKKVIISWTIPFNFHSRLFRCPSVCY